MSIQRIALACLLLTGCSSDGATPSGTGGVYGSGGLAATGAVPGNGGAPTGGAFTGSTGGAGGTASGGTTGAGNSPSGGTAGTGGGVTDGGSPGTGATPGSGGGTGGPNACGTANLLPVPADTSARGPWKVGVKTVTIGRLTVELMYPAKPGTEAGKTVATYDIRDWLPTDAQQPSGSGFTPITPEESPAVTAVGGDVFRDLPIDDAHGPYPVVIFMHGTSSFRIASGTLNAIWASRGMVVLAADYPGLVLRDQLCAPGLGCNCTKPPPAADYPGDFKAQMDALKAPTGDLAFLANHLDMAHIGLSGHSVGGCTAAVNAATIGAEVVVPLSSAAPTTAAASLKSSLSISGMADTVFAYQTGLGLGNIVCPGSIGTVTDAYNATTGVAKKRLMGVTGGGHLVPTDLCQTNKDNLNAIQILHAHHWCAVDGVAVIGLPALFDCGASGFDWKVGVKDVAYAATAALEETLTCQDRTAAFANMKTANPTIGDFKEAK